MSFCCFSKEKDIPAVEVDVSIQDSCNCCNLLKRKKHKIHTVKQSSKVDKIDEKITDTDKVVELKKKDKK